MGVVPPYLQCSKVVVAPSPTATLLACVAAASRPTLLRHTSLASRLTFRFDQRLAGTTSLRSTLISVVSES